MTEENTFYIPYYRFITAQRMTGKLQTTKNIMTGGHIWIIWFAWASSGHVIFLAGTVATMPRNACTGHDNVICEILLDAALGDNVAANSLYLRAGLCARRQKCARCARTIEIVWQWFWYNDCVAGEPCECVCSVETEPVSVVFLCFSLCMCVFNTAAGK